MPGPTDTIPLDLHSRNRLQAALSAFATPGGPLFPTRRVRHAAQATQDALFPAGRITRRLVHICFRLLHPMTWPLNFVLWLRWVVMAPLAGPRKAYARAVEAVGHGQDAAAAAVVTATAGAVLVARDAVDAICKPAVVVSTWVSAGDGDGDHANASDSAHGTTGAQRPAIQQATTSWALIPWPRPVFAFPRETRWWWLPAVAGLWLLRLLVWLCFLVPFAVASAPARWCTASCHLPRPGSVGPAAGSVLAAGAQRASLGSASAHHGGAVSASIGPPFPVAAARPVAASMQAVTDAPATASTQPAESGAPSAHGQSDTEPFSIAEYLGSSYSVGVLLSEGRRAAQAVAPLLPKPLAHAAKEALHSWPRQAHEGGSAERSAAAPAGKPPAPQ